MIRGNVFEVAVREAVTKTVNSLPGQFYVPRVDRRPGINVVMQGTTARTLYSRTYNHVTRRTDIKGTIWMPSIPEAGFLSRGEADQWTGYWVHELYHMLYTDLDAFQAAARQHGPGFKRIMNALEDVRIEGCGMRDGAVRGGKRCIEVLVDRLLARSITPTKVKGKQVAAYDPNDIVNLPWTLALLGRVQVLGYDLPEARGLYNRIHLAKRPLIDYALSELRACQSTQDVIDLTHRVIARIKQPDQLRDDALSSGPDKQDDSQQDEKQQSRQPKSQPERGEADDQRGVEQDAGDAQDDADQGGSGGQGEADDQDEAEEGDDWQDGSGDAGADDQDGSDQGAGSAEGGNADGEAGDQDGGSDDAGDSDSADAGEGSDNQEAGTGGSGADDAPVGDDWDGGKLDKVNSGEVDIERLAEQITKRTPNDDTAHREYGGYTESKVAAGAVAKARQYEVTYDKVKAGLPASINRLRSQLERLLVSPARGGWDHQQVSGRVDRRAYSRLMAGSERVFSRRWETEGLETLVSILVDCSGSMGGERARRAAELCVALGESLDRARVEFEIVGFHSGGAATHVARNANDGLVGDESWKIQLHGCHQTCRLRVFKPYGRSFREYRDHVAAIAIEPSGGTPTYPATRAAVERMLAKPAQRKVLFVITDGQPDSGPHDVKVANRTARASGIDVIGLGIGYDVSQQYEHSITIQRAEDLTGKAMELLIAKVRQFQIGRRTA